MPQAEVHQCECPHCQQETPHPDQELHRRMNLLLSRLDEQQRRWYVAVESGASGGANYAAQAAQTPNVRESPVRFAAPPGATCSLTDGSWYGQTTPLVDASILSELTGRTCSDLRPNSETEQINALERSPCFCSTAYRCDSDEKIRRTI